MHLVRLAERGRRGRRTCGCPVRWGRTDTVHTDLLHGLFTDGGPIASKDQYSSNMLQRSTLQTLKAPSPQYTLRMAGLLPPFKEQDVE